jgi:uncharacterized protein (DUF433 family)
MLQGGDRLFSRRCEMSTDVRTRLSDGRVYHSDPEILGGTPVFVGTRVPVETLMEWLTGGYTLEEFLDNFPTVAREQAVAFLDEATEAALARVA